MSADPAHHPDEDFDAYELEDEYDEPELHGDPAFAPHDEPVDPMADQFMAAMFSRPRRSIAHLWRNLGPVTLLMFCIGLGYLVFMSLRNLASPFMWFVLAVCILAATIPRLFINVMIDHTNAMQTIWRVCRMVIVVMLVASIFNLVPFPVLVSVALIVVAAFYVGTLTWVFADSRIITPRNVKAATNHAAAAAAMRRRLDAHAAANPPRDPDESAYRSLR